MKKILCLGHASYDITIPMDKYPTENIKYRVLNRIECGGGPASNAAYLLGKWGMNTYFSGVLGNDIYGKRIKKEFENVGVDTRYIELSKKYKTTNSFIIVNKKNASRTIFAYRDKSMKMENTNIRIKPDYALFDGEDFEIATKVIRNNPGCITILDAGRAKYSTIKLGKMVNYLVASKNFAEDFTGVKINYKDYNSLVKVYNLLEKDFTANIVITLESHGCLYKIDGKVKIMPGYKVKAIDTTGAGDIFHGAFVYALVKGYSYEDILRIANITGALSTTKIGGRYSIPDINEVLSIYEKSK
ncbi:MAG: PfkB family carbohydrate kinase [Tenericutes bacterium]|nr:PfkB family carbohydrate kinase [Mycoplasmatota bacterium]